MTGEISATVQELLMRLRQDRRAEQHPPPAPGPVGAPGHPPAARCSSAISRPSISTSSRSFNHGHPRCKGPQVRPSAASGVDQVDIAAVAAR